MPQLSVQLNQSEWAEVESQARRRDIPVEQYVQKLISSQIQRGKLEWWEKFLAIADKPRPTVQHFDWSRESIYDREQDVH